ncbi:MAG: peptidyl-prolyl cis-trans isomerase [candidate division WOR-3 bacterium]
MILTFALILWSVPQDYINLLMEENYEAAKNYCEEMIAKTKGYEWKVELGDLYFDKLSDYDRAEKMYKSILNEYPQKDGWVHYRMGLILEMNEDYLNAAKQYEIVATRFRKSPLDSFALTGVERCFKKNYQDTVATVDGYNITRLELDEKMAKASPFGKKDERSVLDQMILERLLYTNALKYKVYEMDVYKESISQHRRAGLLEEVRTTDVVARAKPTEKEMRDYYKRNKESYKLQEEIKGKEIIVESDSLANFIYDSLKKDLTSFDTLAKLYSTASTKSSGGNMGIVYRGSKPKEVEEVLFKAKVNSLTEIVRFDNKYGIFLVTEHKPERYRTYEEVKTQVEAGAQAEKVQKIENELIKNLKGKAKVEIYKDSLTYDSISAPKEKIVARVNGRVVTLGDVEKRNKTQPRFGQVDLSIPEEFEKILNTMIEEDLKLEWAEKNKYFLNDGYISRFQEARKRALEQALYTKIVVETVVVDSNEVENYYKEHKEDMKIPETVRAKEIVVKTREEAIRIRQELVKLYGKRSCLLPIFPKKVKITDFAKFDSLVKEYSIAGTKSRNGDVGLLKRGIRPKEFEDVAFRLKPNELSPVFLVGDSNWTIITVTEHTPPTYRPFEEVKQAIEMNLRREKQRKVADEFLAKIRQEANIRIMLPEEKPEEEKKEEKIESEKAPEVPADLK